MAKRLGVLIPPDIEQAPSSPSVGFATFEEFRDAWPKDRDLLPIEEDIGSKILGDEDARTLCRKFHPTQAEVQRILDWATERCDPENLRWLLVLYTDCQVGEGYRRWHDTAEFLARIDLKAAWDVLEGDWEDARLGAAALLVVRTGDAAAIDRLMQLCVKSALLQTTVQLDWVLDAAVRLNARLSEGFRTVCERRRQRQIPRSDSTLERNARKSAWPPERDRVPRPKPAIRFDRRPELDYPTEPTELSESLQRIRTWFDRAGLEYPNRFRPGRSQAEIGAVIENLPIVLTQELCELYRWADGTEDASGYLIWYDLFRPLEGATHDYYMMCDIDEVHSHDTWKKTWFPVFSVDGDFWIQRLSASPAARSPMIHYYIAGGEPQRVYRSLTEMMSIYAACYDQGVYSVEAGELRENAGRLVEIHRQMLGRRWRGRA
jgi:hypothetical protein